MALRPLPMYHWSLDPWILLLLRMVSRQLPNSPHLMIPWSPILFDVYAQYWGSPVRMCWTAVNRGSSRNSGYEGRPLIDLDWSDPPSSVVIGIQAETDGWWGEIWSQSSFYYNSCPGWWLGGPRSRLLSLCWWLGWWLMARHYFFLSYGPYDQHHCPWWWLGLDFFNRYCQWLLHPLTGCLQPYLFICHCSLAVQYPLLSFFLFCDFWWIYIWPLLYNI